MASIPLFAITLNTSFIEDKSVCFLYGFNIFASYIKNLYLSSVTETQ